MWPVVIDRGQVAQQSWGDLVGHREEPLPAGLLAELRVGPGQAFGVLVSDRPHDHPHTVGPAKRRGVVVCRRARGLAARVNPAQLW